MSTKIEGGTPNKPPRAAELFMAEKVSDLLRRPGQLDCERIRLEDLGRALETRYRAEGRDQSLRTFRQRWPALEKYFGGMRANQIRQADITAYAVKRRDEDKISVAVVNLELSLLRRSFSLLRDQLPNPPKITHLPGAHRRQGKVPDETLQAILEKIVPRFYAPVVLFLRLTGWRSKYATLLEWRHVDWPAKVLRYPTSKNGRPLVRAFGKDSKLLALLEEQQQEQGRASLLVPWVFCHPDGSKITLDGLRGAWAKACRRAGYRGGLHDLRRTRVNEQERHGIPMTIGMAMIGIATPWVYRLYSSVGTSEQEEWLAREAEAGAVEVVKKFASSKESS